MALKLFDSGVGELMVEIGSALSSTLPLLMMLCGRTRADGDVDISTCSKPSVSSSEEDSKNDVVSSHAASSDLCFASGCRTDLDSDLGSDSRVPESFLGVGKPVTWDSGGDAAAAGPLGAGMSAARKLPRRVICGLKLLPNILLPAPKVTLAVDAQGLNGVEGVPNECKVCRICFA